jgi:ketosteroid isomerase-like protein
MFHSRRLLTNNLISNMSSNSLGRIDISARNKIYNLLSHPRSQEIKLIINGGPNSKYAHFEVKGKTFKGLHKTIKSAFENKPQCSADASDILKRVYTKTDREAIERKEKCKRYKHTEHGKLVDEQFGVFCECLNNQEVKTFAEKIQSKGDYVDPCTIDLIKFFKQNVSWVPLACQVCIYSDILGLATPIDILARNKDDRRAILVELKTSISVTDTRYMDYNDFMAFDSDYNISYLDAKTSEKERSTYQLAIANSQYVVDQLQLLIMKYILENEYGIFMDDYCVVRIHLTDVKMYFHNPELYKVLPIIFRAMLKKKGDKNWKDIPLRFQ